MAQKFDVISELYDRACLEIITDPVKWQSFLQTAGRNFKLRFDEQFLLFIQRPDATAVLEIERWNETFERWVIRVQKVLLFLSLPTEADKDLFIILIFQIRTKAVIPDLFRFGI